MLSITKASRHQKQVTDHMTYFIQAKRSIPDWGLSQLLNQLATCRTRNDIELTEELLAQYALGRIKPIIDIEGVRWIIADEN